MSLRVCEPYVHSVLRPVSVNRRNVTFLMSYYVVFVAQCRGAIALHARYISKLVADWAAIEKRLSHGSR